MRERQNKGEDKNGMKKKQIKCTRRLEYVMGSQRYLVLLIRKNKQNVKIRASNGIQTIFGTIIFYQVINTWYLVVYFVRVALHTINRSPVSQKRF